MLTNTNFLSALGWALIHSLWQMALLWIVSQFLLTAQSKLTPAKKSKIAVSLLFTGFVFFIGTLVYCLNGNVQENVLLFSFGNTQFSFDEFMPIIAIAYLLFLFFSIARYVRNYRYVTTIKTYGLSKVNAQWRVFVKKTAAHLSIKKDVKIWFSEFVNSPVTVGFIKPVILLPVAAFNNLTVQQAEAILLHELAHIKRNDYLVNLLINIIKTVLFFNPFVHAFVKMVEQEREKSCDELVLQFQYPAYEYAEALLAIQQQNRPQRIFALAAAGQYNLLHRVETILGVNSKKSFSSRSLLSLLLAVGMVLASFYLKNNQTSASLIETSMAYQPLIEKEKPVSYLNTNLNQEPASGTPLKQIAAENNVNNTEPVAFEDVDNIEYTPAVSPQSGNVYASYYEEVKNSNAALKKYQQKQVNEALASSKKVICEIQWKEIEKDLAEVFNPAEKAELKKKYEKELNKMDWEKWEQKLNLAFNKIDWGKVNEQLSVAVNNIRMDSIQQVYNIALSKLNKVEKQLTQNEINFIPDTDITPELVERKKKEALDILKKLAEARKKKIIRL